MGGVFAKALGRLVGKKEMRILMVRASTSNQPCALCDPRPCVTACAQTAAEPTGSARRSRAALSIQPAELS
jgi:Fe-S-cluster-containing hydrogenase component 2